MKNILEIIRFEYVTCVRNKAFLIITGVLLCFIILGGFVPGLINSFSVEEEEEPTDDKSSIVINVSDGVYEKESVKAEFEKFYPDTDVHLSSDNADKLSKKVDSGKEEFAVIIDKELHYTYITKNNSLYDMEVQTVGSIIQVLFAGKAVSTYGISQEQVDALFMTQPSFDTITTGKDQTSTYMPAYILMIVLFMAITAYGQLVAQSVVTEKNTRAMELLITCAKPTHLIFGKVVGSGLGGLTQLAVLLLSAFASFSLIAKNSIPDYIISMLDFPLSSVLYALLFFILGYFMFAFLLGGLASFASKSEDLNGLISPVMMILTIIYMTLIFMCFGDSVNNPVLNVMSYLPLSAPMAMLIRVTMTDVAWWEIILSVFAQLLTILVFGLFASAVYRIGVLMYGNPPKFGEIFRMLSMELKTKSREKASE